MTNKAYQRFGEEAVFMHRRGWEYLIESKPGEGIYREFRYHSHKVVVIILPSKGFPIIPPVVVLLADSDEVFEEIKHPCIWLGSLAEPIAEKLLSKKIKLEILNAIKEESARVLHMYNEVWTKFSKFRCLLLPLDDFFTENLGLKPI